MEYGLPAFGFCCSANLGFLGFLGAIAPSAPLATPMLQTVKSTDFKFDMRVSTFEGQSGYGPLKIFRKGGVARIT